jgi:asparagine synthase (glutamine-hydrolysing)
MCGITGIVGPGDLSVIGAMTDALTHRGPSDRGCYVADGVALGVRRLSIIDVDGGHQPMANEDGGLRVVFNGELYNYPALRQSLLRKGHHLRTRCDTEALIHLYEEYGDAAPHALRGMFAYAIWDARRRRLFIARDRLGIKPLFYTQIGETLLFASEAKALLLHPAVTAELDETSLELYLALQYVPGPRTMFKGIQKLPAGHILVFERGHVDVRRYWDVVFGEGSRRVRPEDAADEFKSRFREAVRTHLMSDVPVGVLLSGGLDSSSVVAMMHADAGPPIRTFTAGFGIPGVYDERSYAREVASRFRTEHQEVMVEADAVDLLPKLVWHFDEPVADAAALPTYLLCRFARQSVPVVLTGEGSDELLAGYPRYAWFLVAKRLQQWLPAAVREGVLIPLLRLLPLPERYERAIDHVLSDSTDTNRHLNWIGNMPSAVRRQLMALPRRVDAQPDPSDIVEPFFQNRHYQGDRILHALLSLDMHTWLVDDVLAKVDRMSMAASVEARVPFLDHALVEWTAALPANIKVEGRTGKRLLRDAMKTILPRRTQARRKQGFIVPTDAWMRGSLRDFVGDVLLGRTMRERGWFHAPLLETMVQSHWAGASHGQTLWSLLCLELWARTFLDHSWPTPVPASIS